MDAAAVIQQELVIELDLPAAPALKYLHIPKPLKNRNLVSVNDSFWQCVGVRLYSVRPDLNPNSYDTVDLKQATPLSYGTEAQSKSTWFSLGPAGPQATPFSLDWLMEATPLFRLTG